MAKNANIKIKSDTKDAQNGIQKVTSELNKLAKEIKNSDVAMGNDDGSIFAFFKTGISDSVFDRNHSFEPSSLLCSSLFVGWLHCPKGEY